MPSLELRKLWKLHLVDQALLEIRNRAAALDPGRKIMGEIALLEIQYEAIGGTAKALSAELIDRELAVKTIDEKLKKIDREIYGGKVVNPREVENLEKEVSMFKRQRGEIEGRVLELWEELPPAKAGAEKLETEIAGKRTELAEHQKKAMATKAHLEKEFKEKSAMRPELAKEMDKGLLARYESIRQKQAGIGVAEVVKGKSCGGCGTSLPERTLQGLREDRVVICESCHRILYYSEGAI